MQQINNYNNNKNINTLNILMDIKDTINIEIKNNRQEQVFTNNNDYNYDKMLADFIGISSSSKSSFASSQGPSKFPTFICVSHLSFVFPWIMLNHRKEFRRIRAVLIEPSKMDQFNQFYNFQFIFLIYYFYLIMLILNCNFNLVLWKMAENIIQINDS